MDINQTMLIVNFVYCFIVAFMYFIKRRMKNIENRLYEVLVVSNLIGLVLEYFCGVLIKQLPNYEILNFIINKLHISNIILWITIFTLYVVITCFGEKNIQNKIKKKEKKISNYLYFYILFLIIIIFLLPLKYYNDGTYIYSYGAATNIISILSIVYLGIDFISVQKNFNKIDKIKLLPLFALIVGLGGVMFIRSMNPGIVLISTAFSLVTVIMFHTIEILI